MEICTAFDQLVRLGLTTSQVQFSSVWLGRSPRYFSHLLATGREPGLATLTALHWRLRMAAGSMDASVGSMITDIADDLQTHIERRAIVDLRTRLPQPCVKAASCTACRQ